MITEDKQRIEKDAITYEDKHPYDSLSSAYYMGATAELERSEKLLQEYRELLELADLALSTVRTEPTMDGSVLGAFDRRLFISRLADFYDVYQKLHQPNRAI